jgi:hypothetical protein
MVGIERCLRAVLLAFAHTGDEDGGMWYRERLKYAHGSLLTLLSCRRAVLPLAGATTQPLSIILPAYSQNSPPDSTLKAAPGRRTMQTLPTVLLWGYPLFSVLL